MSLTPVDPSLTVNDREHQPPTWTKWHEIGRVIAYPLYLRKTVRVALIVGTVLFAINHLDEVVRGHASFAVWVKAAVTYLVPFCVSNIGLLIATRRRAA